MSQHKPLKTTNMIPNCKAEKSQNGRHYWGKSEKQGKCFVYNCYHIGCDVKAYRRHSAEALCSLSEMTIRILKGES